MKKVKPKVKITLATYKPHRMGFVSIDQKLVFVGNYWDFHQNCHGPKIGGYNLSGLWTQGMTSLAKALKSQIEATGQEVELLNKDLTKPEYQALGF